MVEHYHHQDSYYLHNGTHDAFFTGERLPSRDALRVRGAAGDEAGTFELAYLWQPGDIPYNALSNLEADFYIGGLHYWVGSNLSEFRSSKALERLFGLHQDAFRFDRPMQRAFWLATPLAEPNLTWPDVKAEVIQQRSVELRAIAKEMQAAGLDRFHVVPFDDMAAAGRFPRNTKDGVHWQCSFGEWPSIPSMNDYKTPPGGDCHDYMNLNLLQMMLNVVCRNGTAG